MKTITFKGKPACKFFVVSLNEVQKSFTFIFTWPKVGPTGGPNLANCAGTIKSTLRTIFKESKSNILLIFIEIFIPKYHLSEEMGLEPISMVLKTIILSN